MNREITFDTSVTQDFGQATTKEWLETNGLGGWASSTICGANTRGYHGLFVSATRPPVGRTVMLSKLEEFIQINKQRYELSCNQFPGTVCDSGIKYFKSFRKDLFPVFEYEVEGIVLEKTIAAIHEQDVVVVTYEVKKAPGEFNLELKPFISCRDYHSLSKANGDLNREASFGRGLLTIKSYGGLPPLYLYIKGSSFKYSPDWYFNFEYKEEQARGLEFSEDLFSHGNFKLKLNEGAKFSVVISTTKCKADGFELLASEKERREEVAHTCPVGDGFAQQLTLAADQFVVKRGDHLKTIIAGYHWFGDWGRDTMIALPGICLVNGRFEDAHKILQTFAQYVNQGIIPNRFPDQGETPEYNTVDATLWYFVAIKKYLDYSKDKKFVLQEMYPILKEIIDWHEKGTHYNIHVDPEDHLLYAGEYGVQLTWMDAKIGNWVVTPRMGKAVEINALWYNALMILCEFAALGGHAEDKELYASKAAQVKDSFLKHFLIEGKDHLCDYFNEYERNEDLRPNQVFVLSLPYSLLDTQQGLNVLHSIEEHLLTPFGLRSLSPENYRYVGHYGGNQWSRDGAYHQGTVWSWLLGPYITAKIRLEGNRGKEQVEKLLKHFEIHLLGAGLGTVSEIFDGDAPHHPKGCIAQAWSVGEILRAYVEDVKQIKH